MDESIITEFSIFYKRMIVVELCIKNLIVTKYIESYNENAYNIVYRYLKNISENRKTNDKIFYKIRESQKTETEKLKLSIDKMYISELLNLFANKVFTKNKKVRNSFFSTNIDTKSTEFQKNQKTLKDFRNCLAHGDINKYKQDKKRFLSALIYFEKTLNCKTYANYNLIQKFASCRKLKINEILKTIYLHNPDYYKDDKILIILFDDIAFVNGYTFKELPQRKSIIREHFRILEKIRNGVHVEPISSLQQILPL